MATTGGNAVFIDTNVLVFANVVEAPLHAVALARLDGQRGAGVAVEVPLPVEPE